MRGARLSSRSVNANKSLSVPDPGLQAFSAFLSGIFLGTLSVTSVTISPTLEQRERAQRCQDSCFWSQFHVGGASTGSQSDLNVV